MVKKAWGGRFKAETDALMREFSESVSFDKRLLEADVAGSIAHARMLGASGIITAGEARRLIAALTKAGKDYREGKFQLSAELEDVHMNVEARLSAQIGGLAGKLHTARSRNDQVALDMRLYFRAALQKTRGLLKRLILALIEQAETHEQAIMPGFTHTRKAQPILLAHYLMAYVEMFLRDRDRLRDCLRRLNLCPLGAGALAGTTFPVNREMVAKELGFAGLVENSLDAVSDRDYLLEFAAASAIIMVHLSRLMEDLIWLSTDEFGFFELPEPFSTGSSMMPNKKNPDAAELVRGKTGRVIGSLVSLLAVMKGAPMAYNRDFQEDKEGMFDLADTVEMCLRVSERLVAGMTIRPDRMREACATGFVLATDLADYLAAKGLPFREAHEVAGKLVKHCEEKGCGLEDLALPELRRFSRRFDRDVTKRLTLSAAVGRRKTRGGTAPAEVRKQIQRVKKILGEK